MLTNILLITLLIVLISGVAYIRYYINSRLKVLRTQIANIYTASEEIKELIDTKLIDLHSSIAINKQMTLEVKAKLLPRIEVQEKLIAELKANQAPKEVVETVNLINEYLFGAKEE